MTSLSHVYKHTAYDSSLVSSSPLVLLNIGSPTIARRRNLYSTETLPASLDLDDHNERALNVKNRISIDAYTTKSQWHACTNSEGTLHTSASADGVTSSRQKRVEIT